MTVRVELIDEAVDDLPLFLAKLVRLEAVGKDAGLPLGRGLVGWRKIVVGDRNWRIMFSMDREETTATALVIGDRDDAHCCEEAMRRLAALGKDRPEGASLAATMLQIMQARRQERRRK